jgi:hypothetical protein
VREKEGLSYGSQRGSAIELDNSLLNLYAIFAPANRSRVRRIEEERRGIEGRVYGERARRREALAAAGTPHRTQDIA